MMARLTLVLGGARSGKSSHAEALARQTNLSRLYLATAQPFDDEMRDRIRQHRADRDGDGWQTIEEPLDLPGHQSEGRPLAFQNFLVLGQHCVGDQQHKPPLPELAQGLK